MYLVVVISLCAPLLLAVPSFNYDLMTTLTSIQIALIILSPVIIGALVLWRILWLSGRD